MMHNLTISTRDYDDFLFAVHTVRAVEWQGKDYGAGPTCPACMGPKVIGHTAECEIAQVVAADDRREAGVAA